VSRGGQLVVQVEDLYSSKEKIGEIQRTMKIHKSQ
jgi:hypothetical protein